MKDEQAFWRNQSDEALLAASQRLDDYTEDGRAAVLEELSRRAEIATQVTAQGTGMTTSTYFSSPTRPARSRDAGERTPRCEEPDRQTRMNGASGWASAVRKRYANAYSVAEAQVAMGNVIKFLGVLLALGVVVVALQAQRDQFLGGTIIGVGIVVAIIVLISCYVLGVHVCAQGEILRAGLDSAVNTSPFLTDSDRAVTMGIDR